MTDIAADCNKRVVRNTEEEATHSHMHIYTCTDIYCFLTRELRCSQRKQNHICCFILPLKACSCLLIILLTHLDLRMEANFPFGARPRLLGSSSCSSAAPPHAPAFPLGRDFRVDVLPQGLPSVEVLPRGLPAGVDALLKGLPGGLTGGLLSRGAAEQTAAPSSSSSADSSSQSSSERVV